MKCDCEDWTRDGERLTWKREPNDPYAMALIKHCPWCGLTLIGDNDARVIAPRLTESHKEELYDAMQSIMQRSTFQMRWEAFEEFVTKTKLTYNQEKR